MSASYKRKTVTAALGLGSNLGDRRAHIQYALLTLDDHPFIDVVQTSSIYQSMAHVLDPSDQQPDYLNAACLIETSLPPESLLDACMKIELTQGRLRTASNRWHSRTLDIDLLQYGDLSIDRAELVVPHPRLATRRFVLIPLFEIAPDLKIPAPIDRTVQYLLEHCQDDSSVTLYPDSTSESKAEL